jgi:hypothetical protein
MQYTIIQYEFLSKSSDCCRNGTAEVQMIPQACVHLFKTEKVQNTSEAVQCSVVWKKGTNFS